MSTVEDSARQRFCARTKSAIKILSAGSRSVKVKIENLNSRNQARGLFKKIDNGILVEENEDGTLVIKYSEAAFERAAPESRRPVSEIVRRRIDELGTKEPVIQRQGTDRIVVQLPGFAKSGICQNPARQDGKAVVSHG